MTRSPFTDNSQVTALRFSSESEFDHGIDLLCSNRQAFDVTGFNVVLVPLQSVMQAEKILRSARIKFSKAPVVATADLTEAQRAALRKEQNRAE